MDHFWLTDEQFAKIGPHLPTDTRGKVRVRQAAMIPHLPNAVGWAPRRRQPAKRRQRGLN